MRVNTLPSLNAFNTLKPRAAAPQFGKLRKEDEADIRAMLPAPIRFAELLKAYDKNERGHFGFTTPGERQERDSQRQILGKELLKAVQDRQFGREEAQGILLELFQNREKIPYQLPPAVMDVLKEKATAKPSRQEVELPDPIRERLGRPKKGQRVVSVTPQQLLSILGGLPGEQ